MRENSFFKASRKYYKSEKYHKDLLRNVKDWKKHPSQFKLEALPRLLSSSEDLKSLEELAFNSKYLLTTSEFLPVEKDVYYYLTKSFLFKKAVKYSTLANIDKIHQMYLALVILNDDRNDERLFYFMKDVFPNNLRARFCLQLTVYTRLAAKGKIMEGMRRELIRLFDGIEAGKKHTKNYGRGNGRVEDTAIGGINQNIKRFQIKWTELVEVIKICLFVLIQHDETLVAELTKRLPTYNVFNWFHHKITGNNKATIKRLVDGMNPIDLSEVKESSNYPLFQLSNMVALMQAYDAFGLMHSTYVDYFIQYFMKIYGSPDSYLKDNELFAITSDRRPYMNIATPKDLLLHRVVHHIYLNGPKCLRDYFVAKHHQLFPSQDGDPYVYVNYLLLIFLEIFKYSFWKTLEFLKSSPAWTEMSEADRISIILKLKRYAEDSPHFKELKKDFVEFHSNIQLMKALWIGLKFYSKDILFLILGKMDSFDRKSITSLKEVSNEYLNGKDKIFNSLFSTSQFNFSDSNSSTDFSGFSNKKQKGKLKKSIKLLCKKGMKKHRPFSLCGVDIIYYRMARDLLFDLKNGKDKSHRLKYSLLQGSVLMFSRRTGILDLKFYKKYLRVPSIIENYLKGNSSSSNSISFLYKAAKLNRAIYRLSYPLSDSALKDLNEIKNKYGL